MKAYSAESFYHLFNNRLADTNVKVVEDEDAEFIKNIIKDVKWYNKTVKPLGEGLLIEFKPNEGIYLGYNGFAVIDSLEIIKQSYTYPKKSRNRVKEIIDSYYSPSSKNTIRRFDKHSLSVAYISSNPCFFNPRKKSVKVFFNVKINTESVSMDYHIDKDKNGSIVVFRHISLWNVKTCTDGFVKLQVDEHNMKKLLALIPDWYSMSDSERMRYLDNHIK
ncbi:MAG: hypothetical protein IJE12_03705 [Prevotella sp.]|nr:hypothetical protein [Prevotella sp.]